MSHHGQGNFADVLLLIIKALMHKNHTREVRLDKATVMAAENLDIEMSKSALTGGDMVLTLKHNPAPDEAGKLIVPRNANPFVTFRPKN